MKTQYNVCLIRKDNTPHEIKLHTPAMQRLFITEFEKAWRLPNKRKFRRVLRDSHIKVVDNDVAVFDMSWLDIQRTYKHTYLKIVQV